MSDTKAVVEHIIPLSRGGSNEPSNVALSCADCNRVRLGVVPLVVIPHPCCSWRGMT